MSQMPRTLSRRSVYLVGDEHRPGWAVFACPCGTGHIVQVNLERNRTQPAWSVTEGPSGPSIRPSIDVHGDRQRCHYWLRDGAVRWVPPRCPR